MNGDEGVLSKKELKEKLISILAKANINGEITMIEALLIKDAFCHGYPEAFNKSQIIGNKLKEFKEQLEV